MNSQAPRTRTNIAMKKDVHFLLTSRFQSIHPLFKSSLDLRSTIPNHVSIIASQQKDLLITEIIDKNSGDRVWVPWINSGSCLDRHWWMEDEFRVASGVLVRETRLIDLDGVVAGDEVEIV
jgi:hypothetical protein